MPLYSIIFVTLLYLPIILCWQIEWIYVSSLNEIKYESSQAISSNNHTGCKALLLFRKQLIITKKIFFKVHWMIIGDAKFF